MNIPNNPQGSQRQRKDRSGEPKRAAHDPQNPGSVERTTQQQAHNQAAAFDMQQANALGLGQPVNQNLMAASPEQLAALAQLQAQAQQAQQVNAQIVYLQQQQKLAQLQQLQQQQVAGGHSQLLASQSQGLPGAGSDPSLGGTGMQLNNQQLNAQQLLQQQQYQLQLAQAQAAMPPLYNPMLGLQQQAQQFPQYLPPGYGMPPGSLSSQQIQALLQQQYAQTAAPPNFNQPHALQINGQPLQQYNQQRPPAIPDQQNILNINITPQGQYQQNALQKQDKFGKAPVDQYGIASGSGPFPEEQEVMQVAQDQTDQVFGDKLAPNRQKSNKKKEKGSPSGGRPKLNDQNFKFTDQVARKNREGPSESPPNDETLVVGPGRMEKRKSTSKNRKMKAKKQSTFVGQQIAKETASSQMQLGGKMSVRSQIKKQIYHLGQLEQAIKEKQTADRSLTPEGRAGNSRQASNSPNRGTAYDPMTAQQIQLHNQLYVPQQLQQQPMPNFAPVMLPADQMGDQMAPPRGISPQQQAELQYLQEAERQRRFTFSQGPQDPQYYAQQPQPDQMQQYQQDMVATAPQYQQQQDQRYPTMQQIGQPLGVPGAGEQLGQDRPQSINEQPTERQEFSQRINAETSQNQNQKYPPSNEDLDQVINEMMNDPQNVQLMNSSAKSVEQQIMQQHQQKSLQPINEEDIDRLIDEEASKVIESSDASRLIQEEIERAAGSVPSQQQQQQTYDQDKVMPVSQPISQAAPVKQHTQKSMMSSELNKMIEQEQQQFDVQQDFAGTLVDEEMNRMHLQEFKDEQQRITHISMQQPELDNSVREQRISQITEVKQSRPGTGGAFDPSLSQKEQTKSKAQKKDSKIDSFKNPKSKKSSQKDKSFKAESIKDKSIVQKSDLSGTGKFSNINLEIPIIQEDDPEKLKQSTYREQSQERPEIKEMKAMPVSAQGNNDFELNQDAKPEIKSQKSTLKSKKSQVSKKSSKGNIMIEQPSQKERVSEQTMRGLDQAIAPIPEPEPEVIFNLAETTQLPSFDYIIKTKETIDAYSSDDTDGYKSEELDVQKAHQNLWRKNNNEKTPKITPGGGNDDKSMMSRTQDMSSQKSRSANKKKEKNKKKDESGSGSGSEEDSDYEKRKQIDDMKKKQKKEEKKKKGVSPGTSIAVIEEPRERYESENHETIKQQMYLSQRGLLYQVRQLQQKKGHKFLIIQAENNLYEYLQEFKEEIIIDKSGIFEINHPKKIYFEIFVIILAIYNCFGIPLEICFSPVAMEATEFLIINTIIDIIFGIDIYVQFKTTFYDPLSGDEVFDKKIIFWTYMKGRFIVDFLATVPFDNITYAITRQESSFLPLFSLLKLIRVTRLGRIIERMNVREHIKLMMKLSQIIFMLIMFIHCQACAWFLVVSQTKDWTAPLDSIDPNNDLYNDTTTRKYLISVYYSILLLTCNDITPKGQWKIFFCASAVTLGAIINSIIFGNMALIIQNLNLKNTEFQESIDLANTAMKNMDMPKDLQQDVISYLQYTQQSQNGQQEFEYFYQCLSPSLRNEVIILIFKEITQKCDLFQGNSNLIDFFIQSLVLMLLDPEFPLINQGEQDQRFFFIKQGECEIFVKDPETKKDVLVRTLKGGNFFGEVSLLTKHPRSASVRPKNYAMVGYFNDQKFDEMVFMFPEVRSELQKHFFTYQDCFKVWQKKQLRNIQFMYYLPEVILDELTVILNLEIFEENQEIFKQGQYSDKVYILARGKIEIFLNIPDGELYLDTLSEPGCVMSMISLLNRMKLTYCARAKEDTEMLTITYTDLMNYQSLNHMAPLNKAIEEFKDNVIEPKNFDDKVNRFWFLDYTKNITKHKDSKSGRVKFSRHQLRQIWADNINKACMLCRFHHKKDNILSDLIAELKKQNMDETQKSLNKMKELVKSIAPIIVSKLKKLVSNRIKQVYQESLKQNQSIKNIHSIVQLINEQHKLKSQQQSAETGGRKGGKSSKRKSDDDQDDLQSPSRYGAQYNPSLQNIQEEEEDDHSKSSQMDSVNLTEEDEL